MRSNLTKRWGICQVFRWLSNSPRPAFPSHKERHFIPWLKHRGFRARITVRTSSLHTLQLDGVRLAYIQAGSGTPPLVFLHGWAGDHTTFTPQFEHFSQTHRTIAVDLVGHGQSDKPNKSYTVASFAQDIAWLRSKLGVTKPVIVGHSMGGNIALEIAARYPELPAAIILLDSVFAAACRVPVAYIATTNPMADLARFRSLCPQLVTSQVMQAGHFAPLVAPDQVNAMIERFLAFNIASR